MQLRPDNDDMEADSHNAGTADDTFDALVWLPTNGLEPALEVGAVRILEVGVEAESVGRGRLTGAVTVKFIDVQELRRIATRANPEEAGLITASLAMA